MCRNPENIYPEGYIFIATIINISKIIKKKNIYKKLMYEFAAKSLIPDYRFKENHNTIE